MKLVKKILNKFNGLYYQQEFLCLSKESFFDPLHVYLVQGNKIIKDITNYHLFVGYSPLIFALPSLYEMDLSQTEDLDVSFAQINLTSNDTLDNKDALATIRFKKKKNQFADHKRIYFYEGQYGKHNFTNKFHQLISQLSNSLYNKKPGNVFLEGNLYQQVQIAYAIPRIISIITIAQNNLFNLFPTDLHGQIDQGHYIISLRHAGKAALQVELTKKILLTQVDPASYKTVYSLGKNHMQELKEKDKFPFGGQASLIFQIPIPQHAGEYRELELIDFFDHGIHRLFFFKILNVKKLDSQVQTLSHIHNAYATWRHNNGLSGNYLLR